ncbi:MAG: HD domain-containing protein [Tunicatimonas sp.]|uniref:CCA tRNA nucleotidyltransferase n=1 Tax=Tunicatimonas sp. TaxID=1940096 RepID=UPI003C796DD6
MNLKDTLHSNPIFSLVAQTAHQMQRETYVVGGYVRDLLLKRSSKDIDFVCVGDGISLAKKVAENLKTQEGHTTEVAIFKNFGTAMVKREDYELEFVGARKESYQRDSRKPIVENGTLQDDQNRRDFTINAMAISLNNDSFGELIDPFDGVKDLKRKMIKTPLDPAITFSDDPLRMMRAVRFASQLGFDIAPKTFDALIDHAERLQIVSQERITTELNKIILSSPPSYGFKLLFHSQLLHQFFPEMVALQGVETIEGKSHKDNFYHTLQVLDNVSQVSDDLWLRWAAILHDIAKPPTKRFHPKAGWTFHGHEDRGARMVPHIFRRLKLPLDQKMKFVQKLVRLHLRPIALVKKEVTDSAIRRLLYEAGDSIEALMKLCRADITSKNHSRVKRYLQNFDRVEQKMQLVEEKDHLRNFQPVITGEDIMTTFNLKPSRVVGEIKSALREAVLDGKIRNEREEAYAYMLKIADKKGLTPKK